MAAYAEIDGDAHAVDRMGRRCRQFHIYFRSAFGVTHEPEGAGQIVAEKLFARGAAAMLRI